jgi:hypothetical protein
VVNVYVTFIFFLISFIIGDTNWVLQQALMCDMWDYLKYDHYNRKCVKNKNVDSED